MPRIFPERLATPAPHARMLRRLLSARGVLLGDSGRQPEHADGEGTVPLSQDGRLLQLAEQCGQGPLLGYAAGCASQPADHGVLGFALMSCPTLGDALALWSRFAPALVGGFEVHRVIAEDRLELHIRDPFSSSLPGRQVGLDRFIAFTVQLCLQLGQVPPPALELRLALPLLKRAKAASNELALPPLRPAQAGAHLVLPSSYAAAPVATRQPTLLPTLLQQCQREAAHANRPGDWVGCVERLLECRLKAPLTIEQAASALCVSTRTLKRRLSESNRTYRSIVDDLRKREALQALSDPALRIEDLATRLGYTDQANFARAFRRWTGQAPGRYRGQIGDRASPSPSEPLSSVKPTVANAADGRNATELQMLQTAFLNQAKR